MKNYFKKFSIMFMMALAIIGIGMIQNGYVVNATIIGQELVNPEEGWTRYEHDNNKIIYNGSNWINKNGGHYLRNDNTGSIKFGFYGSKFRIISWYDNNGSPKVEIKIDGNIIGTYSAYSQNITAIKGLIYEDSGLSVGHHIIELKNINTSETNGCNDLTLKAIDINYTGYLVDPNESIALDKSTINLTEGDSDKLTAITTPSAVGVTWKSSDPSIATIEVDPTNGKIVKVNALKEGTCTITATTTDGSNLSASCAINVTKKDVPKPDNPTTDTKIGAILIINLTDGETKVFDVSNSEVDKFKSWYNNKSEFENKLTYVFNKTVNSTISVEEDVVHNQITSFEIRKY
ncbi:Ig-like domain-containing protein [Clostridium sp. YIM B02555]|uniref:Ig-like domain-containing protein n=1 Tax=Clostridium sp. YIM B02555 TaxID=2911968 RepID=UPI001EED0568|nr:Ig-like domain-containing protein [Clostridium sp. YIM B02555]